MNSISTLSTNQLQQAIGIKTRIEALEAELESVLGGTPAYQNGRGKRQMSTAAKTRFAAAQRARWAKIKGNQAGAPEPVKKRRKMSAEGRARIAAAAKARWAKFRAEKK